MPFSVTISQTCIACLTLCQEGKEHPLRQICKDLKVKQKPSQCINLCAANPVELQSLFGPAFRERRIFFLGLAAISVVAALVWAERSAWGILSAVGPTAGLFSGTCGMIYARWQTHAFSHQLRSCWCAKITVTIELAGQEGKKCLGKPKC